MDLIGELKRRNVIRVAGLYLVGGWLAVQVADTLFPVFGLPGWALRGVVVLLAIGFVPALVVAWMFELTPRVSSMMPKSIRPIPSRHEPRGGWIA